MTEIVDFHSHILPGIDDGSRSVEESIAMLQMEAEQGITHVVATPHFYPQHDNPESFLRRRAAAEALLREQMQKHPGLPKLSVGAEVYYFPGISHSEAIQGLTIDKKRCMLLEMPGVPWTRSMYQELEDLHTKQGLIPIIAHVDRYIRPLHTYGIPRRLAEIGVLVQANGNFFIRRETERMAMKLLKTGHVHLIGSDCHGLETRRPNVKEAAEKIERKLGRETLSRISDLEEKIFNQMDLNGVIE